jgi:hypothetical protein
VSPRVWVRSFTTEQSVDEALGQLLLTARRRDRVGVDKHPITGIPVGGIDQIGLTSASEKPSGRQILLERVVQKVTGIVACSSEKATAQEKPLQYVLGYRAAVLGNST